MTRLSFFGFLFLFVTACCDDEPMQEDPNPAIENGDHEPMSIGNQWIYQVSIEQADGTYETRDELDTVSIVGEEQINDNVYYKYEARRYEQGNNLVQYYRRDSVGYIIDEHGTIYYSPNNSEGVLNTITLADGDAEFFVFEYSMADQNTTVEVPAGTFQTRSYVGKVIPGSDWNEDFTCEKSPYTNYAQDVGIVKREVYYVSSCRSIVTELVEYQLK